MRGMWIGAIDDSRNQAESVLYVFEKTFRAETGDRLTVSVTGDSRLMLYLNGALVAEGPSTGPIGEYAVETFDATAHLRPGENVLEARVLHLGWDATVSVTRGPLPALWLIGELTGRDGFARSFRTDGSWACAREDGHRFFRGPELHPSMPEFEAIGPDLHRTKVPVTELYESGEGQSSYDCWGLAAPYRLTKRPIPPMETGEEKPLTVLAQGDGFCELDAGAYTTAKVRFRFAGAAGGNVKITYAECRRFPKGDGTYGKGRRDDPAGVIAGAFDTVALTGDEQTFAPFYFRAFRFIRLDWTGDFTLSEATAADYFYPLAVTGRFACPDGKLNRMWEVSLRTVRCCLHETYVDCPYYEQQQYGMDAALEALFTYRFAADDRPARKALCDLAASMRPDGMLEANWPSRHGQVITPFPLYWIFMLREYLLYSGDDGFVRSMTGVCDRILECFRTLTDERGLIRPTEYWPFIDWIPGWEQGVTPGGRSEPLTAICLLYATALKAASEICRRCGRSGLAREYETRRMEQIAAVRAAAWDEAKGLFRNTPGRQEYTQHTAVWAVLSGAVTGEEAKALLERTFDRDEVTRCTFAMNFYLLRALETADLYDRADEVMNGWRQMLDWGCTTWCENPDDPRSECHGWSSAPAYELSAMILGVRPTEPGFRSVEIRPYCGRLPWATGAVPTPLGPITVSWRRGNGKLTLDGAVPEGMKVCVCLQGQFFEPDGPVFHCETEE